MALFDNGYSRNRIEQAAMKTELELKPERPARVCVMAMIMLVCGALPAQTPREQVHLSHQQATTRARQLVARMTLDEKIAQVHGIKDATHFRFVPSVPRLGIPELRVTNGPAGVGPGGAGSQKPATAWPAPIALAASWDTDLARTYGRLAADETRSLGSNLLESPDINIARVPQGGRVFESYGEDPYLASRLAVANIEGIQSTGVMANVKHYVANNQEADRGSINEIISERALHETYMPAFEASVKQAHVASLMCAYPRVNGLYNCENTPLLARTVRGEWGFDGFITSDFGAVHSTTASVVAGLDLELPTGIYFGDALRKKVISREIPESMIDEMLVHRYAKMMQLGWFGTQSRQKPIPVLEHGAAARSFAEQSMVLLKNEGSLLPLNRDRIQSVALLGPYAVHAATGGGGSSHVIPLYSVTPYDGVDTALLSQTKLTVLDGSDVAAAVDAARKANIAIVMVGDDEREGTDHGIELPPVQNALIAAVAEANPKTIVVLKTGSAVLMPWLQDVPAVLEAWYPGEEDGSAVADVLFGKVNPSGKLPITFPRTTDDTLAAHPDQYPGDGKTVHYSEGLNVGYRAYSSRVVVPLFAFGYGLSYATFQFSDLKVTPKNGRSGATVSFYVSNTAKLTGAEVAQVYLRFPPIAAGDEPPLQLKGFCKVTLKAGQKRVVKLELDKRAFSYWSDEAHGWQTAPGTFHVMVGDSSVNTPLSAELIVQ
jgi:beta-glucosidase